MTPLSRTCVSHCCYSVVTVSVSCTVSEISSVRLWRDVEIWVQGH